MKKQRFRKLLPLLLYFPLLLLVFVLQDTVFSRLPIYGAKPLLIPLSVVGIALFGGYFRGGVFGLFAGILCDISLNQSAIQFTLFLTMVGLAVGFAADTILARGFPTFLLCSFLTLALAAFIQAFDLLFFYNSNPVACWRIFLVQTVYSMLFALPIYYFCRNISRLHRL